jgi:type III pantothenate kinase
VGRPDRQRRRAFSRHKKACIVVDFGTATTFDYVSEAGDYMGGIIAPGANISAEASSSGLNCRGGNRKAATVIGKNTVAAMQSGSSTATCPRGGSSTG